MQSRRTYILKLIIERNENDISEQKGELKKRIKEKEKEKENSSSNRTIKFRNSRKITINNTETNTNTNADLVQKTERIFKKKRKSSIVKTIEEDQEYIEVDESAIDRLLMSARMALIEKPDCVFHCFGNHLGVSTTKRECRIRAVCKVVFIHHRQSSFM